MNVIHKILRAAGAKGINSQKAFEDHYDLPRGRISKWLKFSKEVKPKGKAKAKKPTTRKRQSGPTWEQVVQWAGDLKLPITYLMDDGCEEPESHRTVQEYVSRHGWEALADLIMGESKPRASLPRPGDPIPFSIERSADHAKGDRRSS